MDLSGFMNFVTGLSSLVNSGMGLANLFRPQRAPAPQPAVDPRMFQPPSFSIEMPDMSEFFASLQDSMKPDRTPMLKNLASSASQMRKSMQSNGIYSGGAVTPDALASLMQLDNPNDLNEAWKLYGDQYGLGPLPGSAQV